VLVLLFIQALEAIAFFKISFSAQVFLNSCFLYYKSEDLFCTINNLSRGENDLHQQAFCIVMNALANQFVLQ